MARHVRTRFWTTLALAILSTFMFAITFVWPQWIELLTGFEPDEGSGSLEWMIVVVSAIVAGLSWLGARVEWRRATAAAG